MRLNLQTTDYVVSLPSGGEVLIPVEAIIGFSTLEVELVPVSLVELNELLFDVEAVQNILESEVDARKARMDVLEKQMSEYIAQFKGTYSAVTVGEMYASDPLYKGKALPDSSKPIKPTVLQDLAKAMKPYKELSEAWNKEATEITEWKSNLRQVKTTVAGMERTIKILISLNANNRKFIPSSSI